MARIKSKIPSKEYKDNWDRIFGSAGIKEEGTKICRFCQQLIDQCFCDDGLHEGCSICEREDYHKGE